MKSCARKSNRDRVGKDHSILGGWRKVRPGGRLKISGTFYISPDLVCLSGRSVWVEIGEVVLVSLKSGKVKVVKDE